MTTECGYTGCKRPAAYEIRQLVGKQQVLPCCANHAPEWARTEQPMRFYTSRKVLPCAS